MVSQPWKSKASLGNSNTDFADFLRCSQAGLPAAKGLFFLLVLSFNFLPETATKMWLKMAVVIGVFDPYDKRGRRDSGILSNLDKCIFLFINKEDLQSRIEILVESK